jgi:hypothetical protein
VAAAVKIDNNLNQKGIKTLNANQTKISNIFNTDSRGTKKLGEKY